MNDHISTEESQSLELLSGDNDNMQVIPSAESETLDLRRRRLIRGAVTIAPVVLTLRSGALAAASCTGALGTNYAANSAGNLSPTTNLVANTNQACVTGWTACPGVPGKVLDTTVGSTFRGTVRSVTVGSNTFLRCRITGGATLTSTSNIAIFSSASYNSFKLT